MRDRAPRVVHVLRLLFSTAAVVTAPFLPVGVHVRRFECKATTESTGAPRDAPSW